MKLLVTNHVPLDFTLSEKYNSMRSIRNIRSIGFLLIASLMILLTPGRLIAAQDYPSRPVTVIVTGGPGSVHDSLTRVITKALSDRWNQPIVIEQRAGAAGMLGHTALAKSTPDGYTIASISTTFAGTLGSRSDLPFSRNQFRSVGQISKMNIVLLARSNAPFNDFKQMIAHASANPGAINYVTLGVGSYGHFGMTQIELASKTRMTHVPYKVLMQALPDLIEGRVDLIVGDIYSRVSDRIASGELKIIGTIGDAVTLGGTRVASIDRLYPRAKSNGHYGLLVPTGTPKSVIDKINQDLNEIMKDPAVRSAIESMGMTPWVSTPEDFDRLLDSEISRIARIVQEAQLKVD